MPTLDHYRRLQQYEAWASGRLLEALATARPYEPALIRARGIFAHVQKARALWLWRLGAGEKPAWEMFPDWPTDRCRSEASVMDHAWSRFLDSLNGEGLQRRVSYPSLDGTGYSSLVHEILSHVYNHSTYHRGQIAMLLVQAGGQAPGTDMVIFTRAPA